MKPRILAVVRNLQRYKILQAAEEQRPDFASTLFALTKICSSKYSLKKANTSLKTKPKQTVGKYLEKLTINV